MSMDDRPWLSEEAAAYAFVEACVWAEGRACPHCAEVGKSGKLNGKSTRIGVYKCYACRKPFTVTLHTIFDASHIKMTVWLQAITMLVITDQGISVNELSRRLGITLRSTWYLFRRFQEAMLGQMADSDYRHQTTVALVAKLIEDHK